MQRENPFPKKKKKYPAFVKLSTTIFQPNSGLFFLLAHTQSISFRHKRHPNQQLSLALSLSRTHTHTPPAAAPVRQRVWKNSLLFNAEFHLQNPLGGTRKRFPGAGDDFRHTLAQLWTHGKTLKWPRRAISRTDKLHVSRWLLLTQNTFRTDGRRRQGWQIDGG